MRTLAVVLLLAMSVDAAPRRATVTTESALSITFVDVAGSDAMLTAAGNDGWLDARTLSARGGRKPQPARMRKQVGIRVTRAGGLAGGTARIEARLDGNDGRAKVWIDGRPLGAAPLVVDAHAAVGSMTVHRIEIEVAQSVPEGPINTSIAWDVTTE
jgi:hypothetical protein